MKRKIKVSLITNTVLVLLISVVALVVFIPEKTVAIYGGSEISPYYHGNTENKNVSIMINVYENSDIVNKMVDLFNEKSVKATFFVGGCWADDNEKTLNNIVKSGHEIANHGYFHLDHSKISVEKNKNEILNNEKIIESLCGVKTKLFAPPSGSFSKNTLLTASDLGYKVIMWSKDTIDWRDNDSSKLISRATKNPSNGDLILMHPKEHTLKILPEIIDFYQNKGYSLVTVSENILI